MVVIDQYLELYEAEQVSSGWKGFQIFFYVFGALNSIAAAYTFGYLSHHYLDYNCLLYSDVTFTKDPNEPAYGANSSLTALNLELGNIDTEKTTWGKGAVCAYCQYVPICSFIFCFVWATFFTMCGKGGRTEQGLPAPWRIVYPALIFNLIFFIVSLVAVSMLQGGIAMFCNNFVRNMNETSCENIDHYNRKAPRQSFTYIVLAQLFGWLNVIMWLLSIAILVLRCICVSDFVLYKIEILTPDSIESATAQGSDATQTDETASAGTKMTTKASIEERQLLSYDYDSEDDSGKPYIASSQSVRLGKSKEDNKMNEGEPKAVVSTEDREPYGASSRSVNFDRKTSPEDEDEEPYGASSRSVNFDKKTSPDDDDREPYSASSQSVTFEEGAKPRVVIIEPNEDNEEPETEPAKEKSDELVKINENSKPDQGNPGSST